jgi:BirA family biotin operon repressor/biotin-[acetyl-CoA-carboxylase] ligase
MLKWPNDVLLGDRKVAGVLVEGVVQGSEVQSIVVGVGINVHTRDFPEAIAAVATSIALHADSPCDRAELLADLLAHLDRDVTLVAARGVGLIHGRLSRYDALRGRAVIGGDGERGEASGIDLEGRLTVRVADGTLVRWSAGEVHLGTVAR